MNKILVTGAAGYIGSVLVRQLLMKGYFVTGLDSLCFGGESLLGVYNHPNFEFIKGDIRCENDLLESINGIDSVVHLAAIVGDPACSKQPRLAKETNWIASKLLFDFCNESTNVKQFIFSSTCSNYGRMKGIDFVDEKSPLNPISLYAKLKVKFEDYILQNKRRDDLFPTVLRFSTAYGLSPRTRFDLTVNDFVRELAFKHELEIYDSQLWRPYCHVEDIARSCVLVIESDYSKIGNNVFGVGDTKENYQKKMIVEELLKIYPKAKIKYVNKDKDRRNYRVDFSKIKKELPFKIKKKVPDGMKEIASAFNKELFMDPFHEKYQNI